VITSRRLQDYVNSGSVPNLLLAGTAGVGKTTVAKALCDELELELYVHQLIQRMVSRTLRTKIKNYASTVSLKGGRKVIILDESDYLTAEAKRL
jgi:DNA polymerase III delta prime subunit